MQRPFSSADIVVIKHKMDSLYNWFCTHLNLNKETMGVTPGDKQCEVVLVGCGAPKRGMGEFLHSVFFLFLVLKKKNCV